MRTIGDGDKPLRGLPGEPRPDRRRKIRKTRPCLIVSPDEINYTIRTAIIAPMTTKGKSTRPGYSVGSKARMAKSCLIRSERWTGHGWSRNSVGSAVGPLLDVLREMFKP